MCPGSSMEPQQPLELLALEQSTILTTLAKLSLMSVSIDAPAWDGLGLLLFIQGACDAEF